MLKVDVKQPDVYYCLGDYGTWLVGTERTSLSAFIFGKFFGEFLIGEITSS